MVIACDRGWFHDPCGPSPVCVCHLIRRAERGDNVAVIETGLVAQDGRKEHFRARPLKRKIDQSNPSQSEVQANRMPSRAAKRNQERIKNEALCLRRGRSAHETKVRVKKLGKSWENPLDNVSSFRDGTRCMGLTDQGHPRVNFADHVVSFQRSAWEHQR